MCYQLITLYTSSVRHLHKRRVKDRDPGGDWNRCRRNLPRYSWVREEIDRLRVDLVRDTEKGEKRGFWRSSDFLGIRSSRPLNYGVLSGCVFFCPRPLMYGSEVGSLSVKIFCLSEKSSDSYSVILIRQESLSLWNYFTHIYREQREGTEWRE